MSELISHHLLIMVLYRHKLSEDMYILFLSCFSSFLFNHSWKHAWHDSYGLFGALSWDRMSRVYMFVFGVQSWVHILEVSGTIFWILNNMFLYLFFVLKFFYWIISTYLSLNKIWIAFFSFFFFFLFGGLIWYQSRWSRRSCVQALALTFLSQLKLIFTRWAFQVHKWGECNDI